MARRMVGVPALGRVPVRIRTEYLFDQRVWYHVSTQTPPVTTKTGTKQNFVPTQPGLTQISLPCRPTLATSYTLDDAENPSNKPDVAADTCGRTWPVATNEMPLCDSGDDVEMTRTPDTVSCGPMATQQSTTIHSKVHEKPSNSRQAGTRDQHGSVEVP
jgi:hypothetical protein